MLHKHHRLNVYDEKLGNTTNSPLSLLLLSEETIQKETDKLPFIRTHADTPSVDSILLLMYTQWLPVHTQDDDVASTWKCSD